MDLNTGVFTALVGGTYSITVSGYSKGDRLDDVEASIGLYHNSKCVVKNWWYVYTNNYKDAQHAAITISRNLVLYLALGDTLELRTETCQRTIHSLTFCLE